VVSKVAVSGFISIGLCGPPKLAASKRFVSIIDMVGIVVGVGRQGTVLRRTERDSKLLIVKVGKNTEEH